MQQEINKHCRWESNKMRKKSGIYTHGNNRELRER
jgi:hypothetical protein